MAGVLRVRINGTNTSTISARAGDNLLDSLARAGVYLPAACEGLGSCGLCKVSLSDRLRPYSPIESPWISLAERAKGVHLACQITLSEDLDLWVDPAQLSGTSQEARLAARQELVPGIFKLTLELPEGTTLSSRPGQFIQIGLPSENRPERVERRAYSIASAPGSFTRFEIDAQQVPNGRFSGYLIDQLAIGDSLSFSGPFGGFAAFDSPRELVCAAVGSGMAPIRSLLLGTAQSATRRRISYFFAARRASEIPHLAEIRALERELADFRFIPVLADRSGETSGGVSGSIAEALNRSLKRGTEIDAYICGNARFVDTCSRVLTDKGVRPEAIHSDRFTQGGERT